MALVFWHLGALFLAVTCFLFAFQLLPRRSERSSTAATHKEVIGPGAVSASKAKQTYDAFLVLDVEATCQAGSNFDYPNEIIEFPVCLMRYKASQLEVVEEFRSFVKPSWRPRLSKFCMELTGITQDQVDAAPEFPAVLRSFRRFLVKHRLIEKSGKRRMRFCWCSDGPFDIRDFVVKQCFISQIPIPDWMTGGVLDVRAVVAAHTSGRKAQRGPSLRLGIGSLNIPAQLSILGLPSFIGRQHSGQDDTRNIVRIMKQLALEGVHLQPNTAINPRRRWHWMGKSGEIKEEDLPC
ncbi:ribonuclease H-like domain-containing protein [Mycena galericulata]|nr:ribonuclease H-like domain-containing protein [Mycena galericulata]